MAETQPQAPISLKRFLSDTVVFGLPDFIDKAIGMVLIIILTKVMKVSEYGELYIWGQSAGIIALLFALGMQNSFYRHFTESNDPEHRRRTIGTTLWIVNVNAAFWMLVLSPLATRFNLWAFEQTGVWLTIMMVVSAWLEMTESIAICRVQADGMRTLYLCSRISAIVCIRGLSFYLVVFAHYGPLGWIYGQIVGQSINVLLLYSLGMRDARPAFDWKVAKSMIPYGVGLVPVAISSSIMKSCDTFMINVMMPDPKTKIGFYGVGARISTIMDQVSMSFVLGWRRFAFRNMHLEDGPRLMARGMTMFFLISGYAAFGLCLLGDDLLHWITPRSYEGGFVVIPILTLSGFFWGVGEFAAIGLHKSKETGKLAKLNIFAAIANVALSAPLIYYFGIAGAATATCLSMLGKTIAICIESQKAFHVPFEWGRLAISFVIYLAAYAVGQLFVPFGWKVATPSQMLIAAVTPLVFFGIGFWKPEELELLRSGWQRLRGR